MERIREDWVKAWGEGLEKARPRSLWATADQPLRDRILREWEAQARDAMSVERWSEMGFVSVPGSDIVWT